MKESKTLSYEMPPFDGNTLNVGYRARISGETDFPCIYGEKVGLGRSYVKQKALDYEDWVRGVREGRNYVSDGKSHLIDFKVNDTAMGAGSSEMALAAPGAVKLTAQVAALLEEKPNPEIRKLRADQKPYWDVERSRIGDTNRVPLEVIVNGEVVERREIAADGQLRTESFNVKIDRSSWVALRILPSSHTNPVWVTVGDKPVRSKKSAEWCLTAVDTCFRQKIGRIRLEEQGDMKNAYDHARAEYQRLIRESEQ